MRRRTSTLTVILLLCLVATCRAAAVEAPAAALQPATAGEGRLELHEGIPIVHLKGTPEQMGRQHGELLGGAIRVLLDQYANRFLGQDGLGRLARPMALAVARQMTIPPAVQREMQALAGAARVDYDDVLLINTLFDIKKAAQCTAVAASGAATTDGLLLFGRNLDFPPLGIAHRYSVVFVCQPDHGQRFISVAFPGMVGVVTGMNQAGLAAGVLECYGHSMKPDAMPYAMLYRQVIEGAKTVDEAVELLRAGTRSTANNLMLCDGSGAAAVAEMTPSQFAVRRPEGGLLTAINHFESPALRQTPDDFRIGRLDAFRKRHGKIDLAAVQQALADTALGGINLQAMVLVPQRCALHLAIGEPPAARRRYVHLTSEDLDLK